MPYYCRITKGKSRFANPGLHTILKLSVRRKNYIISPVLEAESFILNLSRYGDKAPKFLLARVLSVVWMFMGVAVMAYLTAIMTTALTSGTVKDHKVIVNKKVSRLRDLLLTYKPSLKNIYRVFQVVCYHLSSFEVTKQQSPQLNPLVHFQPSGAKSN